MKAAKIFSIALASAALASSAWVWAADPAGDYPNRPIRLIVSNAPGSSGDTLTRIVAAKVGEALGQQLVVDNRAGAGGAVGLEIAKHGNPDGYTLITSGSGLTISPHIRKNLPYDPMKDFEYVAMYSRAPVVLTINAGLPVQNVREFLDYAKSKQGKFNMASAGVGSQSHLNGTALTIAAGFQSLHVPYKGGGASMAAVVSGEAQWTFPPAAAVMSLAKAGRVRALAHSLPQRSPLLGDMPAIAETVPGFSSVVVSGLLAPKGTPRRVVDKINATVAKVVHTQEFRDQFASQGAEVATGTPDEFRKAIQHESIELGKAIKAVGLKAE